MAKRDSDGPKIALAALFITALVTAQLVAVKLLVVPFPDAFPVLDGSALVPAGVLAYAITFVASDCYTELYGHREATIMVNVGFIMNFVMLGLVWLAIFAPGSDAGVDPETFRSVLGLSTNIVLGSLGAYIVSQNWDVFIYNRLRDQTEGKHLWLRNIGSTTTSQLIDTIIFVLVGFFILPSIAGIGDVLPGIVLLQLIIGQYVIKLVIALLETPLVYAIVGYTRSNGWVEEPRPVTE